MGKDFITVTTNDDDAMAADYNTHEDGAVRSGSPVNSSPIRTDGGTTDKRQIGPRLEPELANDLKVIIQHLHNGKYKGRLSDEVEKALEIYIGKVLNDHPDWIEDAEDEAQRERFKKYSSQFQDACSSAPMDSAVADELSDMRREIEAINASSTNMLAQIYAEVSKAETPSEDA